MSNLGKDARPAKPPTGRFPSPIAAASAPPSGPAPPRLAELGAIYQDVQAGAELQKSLLPRTTPSVPGYEFGVAYYAAHIVSGDHYDFIALPNGRVGVIIADASGKGVSAALLITMVRALLHAHPPDALEPAKILQFVNTRLHKLVRRGLFVSMTYALLEPESHTLRVANAGHLPTLVWRSDSRQVQLHTATGVVLGAGGPEIFDSRVREEEIHLGAGDRVVLLTDGVNEAMAPGQREFGFEHLKKRLHSDGDRTSAEFIKYIVEQIDIHMAGCEQTDDITIVTFRRRQSPPTSAGPAFLLPNA